MGRLFYPVHKKGKTLVLDADVTPYHRATNEIDLSGLAQGKYTIIIYGTLEGEGLLRQLWSLLRGKGIIMQQDIKIIPDPETGYQAPPARTPPPSGFKLIGSTPSPDDSTGTASDETAAAPHPAAQEPGKTPGPPSSSATTKTTPRHPSEESTSTLHSSLGPQDDTPPQKPTKGAQVLSPLNISPAVTPKRHPYQLSSPPSSSATTAGTDTLTRETPKPPSPPPELTESITSALSRAQKSKNWLLGRKDKSAKDSKETEMARLKDLTPVCDGLSDRGPLEQPRLSVFQVVIGDNEERLDQQSPDQILPPPTPHLNPLALSDRSPESPPSSSGSSGPAVAVDSSQFMNTSMTKTPSVPNLEQ